MNWYLVLALSVPFLFVIGVVYSAIKEQKGLEDGLLQKVLKERHDKGLINKAGAARAYGDAYDDDDDYGVPARADVKRAHESAAPTATMADVTATTADATPEGRQVVASEAQVPQAPQALGNTEARDAASYFAKYYQDENQSSAK